MLETPEVARLTNDIRDSFRIRPNHNPSYVDVADHLTRLSSKQHQIVFGRRGSGKSCLFVHFLHDHEANNGILPIYLDSDELKRLGYPDLLIRCCDPSDHVPPRSYALFQARFALQELGETLRAERRGEVT